MRASHATGASRRSGERGRVSGSLRGEAPRIELSHNCLLYTSDAADVDRIQASGHYLTLHVGREEHVIRGTIREIAARLHPDRFVRVHRSTIVNLDRIKELIPTFHGEYEIVLRDGTHVTSSRGYSERLQGIVRGTQG